jgi:hypothetical protein
MSVGFCTSSPNPGGPGQTRKRTIAPVWVALPKGCAPRTGRQDSHVDALSGGLKVATAATLLELIMLESTPKLKALTGFPRQSLLNALLL